MTWRFPVLPLAPRPLPGEGVLSWVRRVAARYDLDAPGLVALLCPPGVKRHPSHVTALDWTGEAGLDQALAVAARLHPGRIAALRPIPGDPARAPPLYRVWTAWCNHCVRDDVARHGEVYERAVWRLGWCVACPVHGCRLGEACPSCLMGEYSFRAVAGRMRLVCGICRGPVDTVPPAKEGRPFGRVATALAELVAPKVDAAVLVLQEMLLAASTAGTAPSGPLGFGLNAEAFLSLACSLAAPSTWPLRSRPGMAPEPDQDMGTPGMLSVAEMHRRLGDLTTVLAEAADIAGPSHAAPTLGEGRASGELASVLRRSFGRDRDKLRRRAQAWGPLLAPMVLRLLDEQDERARQYAEATERARQEAIQERREADAAREAARRAASEVRRIRARRARRAALARLQWRNEKRRNG